MSLVAQEQDQESSTASSSEKEVETQEINLAVGIDKVIELDFPFNADMNLGDPSLLKVKPDLGKRKITFIGIKAGSTSLTIKDESGEERLRYIISVTSNDQSKIVTELRELLNDVEGLEIGIKGGKVYVGGHIVVPGDIGKVATVLNNYPDVLRLVEMHPQTQRIIAKKMTEELSRFNLKNVSVRVVNNAYWVEGVVGSEQESKLVEQVTQAYLPEKIETLAVSSDRLVTKNGESGDILYFLTVNEDKKAKQEPLPKQIKISTQFVELSKDYSKIFGFKWAPLLNGNGGSINIGKNDGSISTNSENGFTATISNLFPKIQSLKNAGYGRIIQSGMLITKDRQNAEINKTTNIPFVVGSGESARPGNASLTFSLGVTPVVLTEENIDLDMDIRVSLPSGQSNDNGTPITTSNAIKTKLIVKSGQSAVIGGVVQSEDLTAYDKNDPAPFDENTAKNVFFRFLRSKSKSLSKNQYVVFVTPELVQSATEETEEIRRKFRRRRR